MLRRREIVLQCALGLKIEGFSELSEIFNQEVGIHLSTMFQCQRENTTPDQVVLFDQPYRRESLGLPQPAVSLGSFHGRGRHPLHAQFHDLRGLVENWKNGCRSFLINNFNPPEIGIGLAMRQPLFTNAASMLLHETFEPLGRSRGPRYPVLARGGSLTQLLVDLCQRLAQRALDLVRSAVAAGNPADIRRIHAEFARNSYIEAAI